MTLAAAAGYGWKMSTAKIKSAEELEKILSDRRDATVVLTNGCFDLLHVGHIRYMAKARELGDLLIVALNTDASVRRIKGGKRPIVPEGERAEIVAALEMVDYVVLFDENTPAELIQRLKPDIHVKGGDYAGRSLPESRAVARYGGRTIIIDKVEGYSTTNLIERICSGKQRGEA